MEKAYIGLNEENRWTLYWGNGTEAEKYVLAIGREFSPGAGIRRAMAELEQWAAENGYIIDAPLYSMNNVSLEDVIEPEIFDEVFGPLPDDDSQD